MLHEESNTYGSKMQSTGWRLLATTTSTTRDIMDADAMRHDGCEEEM